MNANYPERNLKEIVDHVEKLIQLDMDATLAYQQAIDGIEAEHGDIRSMLERFKADHERHIAELSQALTSLGEAPPDFGRDVKGFFIEGMTALRSALGTKQALKAMRQNEVLTNKQYQDALELEGLPADVLDVVSRGREDERRHLAAIEAALAQLDEQILPAPI